MWTELTPVYAIFVLGLISPGPDFAIILRNSLLYKTSRAVWTAAGIALGLVVHVSYAILGLALLLNKWPQVFVAVQMLGALYLGYLGYQNLRPKQAKGMVDEKSNQEKLVKSGWGLWEGFLTNLLNPKATMFLMSLFAQVLMIGEGQKLQYALGLLIVVSAFVWFACLALIIGQRRIKQRLLSIQPALEKAMGILLLLFALRVLWTLVKV